MDLLNKEQILAIQDLRHEDVAVDGGIIRIGEMTAFDRLGFEDATIELKGNNVDIKVGSIDFITHLLVRCVIDEKGGRVFSDEDRDALSQKSHKTLLKLFQVAKRINGIGDDEAKDIEKNLEADQ